MRRSSWRRLVSAVLVAGCAQLPGTKHRRDLEARLTLPPRDTVRIEAAAVAHRCRRSGVLLVGIDGGSGVLLWTRAHDSVMSGNYPLITRGDTTTPRGGMVSVRFMSGEAGRGITLDSGTITLRTNGDWVTATVQGSGLEPAAGMRGALRATFDSLPLARDTASCNPEI